MYSKFSGEWRQSTKLGRRWLRGRSILALMLAATPLLVTPSLAADSWSGATSTNWFNTTNWLPSAVPTSSDLVYVGTSAINATHIMPTQYRDFMVHEAHLRNAYDQMEKRTGNKLTIPPIWYEQPVYYKGNRLSFIGDRQDVIWPDYSDWMDFELEMAIVIGKKGKSISKADAPNHIFGYTILNDVSARDAQMREIAAGLGPAKGKDFDTGNILGPWIVTADEIAHPVALEMEAKVNGERWGGGNSNLMHHSFADIIAHVSQSETLYPGEVIGSGTVGTGCGLELGKRLAPNDVIELTIESIGTLTNTIRRG